MQLSQETPAERAHHEAILASISMIDDIGMQTARIPLCHEKNDDCLDFFLFIYFPVSAPLCFSVGHIYITLATYTLKAWGYQIQTKQLPWISKVHLSTVFITNTSMFVE